MLFRLATSAATALALTLPTTALADGHVTADTVVATVGDTEITLGHMIILKQRLPQQYQTLAPDVLYEGILDQLVQQTILGTEIDALSAGSVKTLENEERALRASEVVRDIAVEVTTEEAIQAAYDAQIADFPQTKEYNADHILFQLAPDASDEDVAAALARAEETIADLNGGADFATLAQERSEGPSGPNGGALGWFEPGRMVAEFGDAVQAMEDGGISAPVRTQFGWHVIRLNESRDVAPPTLEELSPSLVDEIQRTAIETRVAELEGSIDVTRTTVGDIDPALLDDLSLLGE